MASNVQKIHLSNEVPTEQLFEKVKFSVASLHGQSIVCPTIVHLLGAPTTCNPSRLEWKYLGPVVVAALRTKDTSKGKHAWALHLCMYLTRFGMLAWKTQLSYECDYTALSPEFHVLALEGDEGILGLWYQSQTEADHFNTALAQWLHEPPKNDRTPSPSRRPPSKRITKGMISSPSLCVHVQSRTPEEEQKVSEKFEIAQEQLFTKLESIKLPPTQLDAVVRRSKSKNALKKYPLCVIPIPSVVIDYKAQDYFHSDNEEVCQQPEATHIDQPPEASSSNYLKLGESFCQEMTAIYEQVAKTYGLKATRK